MEKSRTPLTALEWKCPGRKGEENVAPSSFSEHLLTKLGAENERWTGEEKLARVSYLVFHGSECVRVLLNAITKGT